MSRESEAGFEYTYSQDYTFGTDSTVSRAIASATTLTTTESTTGSGLSTIGKIDGTDIIGATIDGDTVTEITVDGDTVYTN